MIQTLGDAVTPILTTKATSRIVLPPVALCTPVSYQVQAFQSAVGWTSPLTPAVPFLRQPSATQRCTDPPTLTSSKTGDRQAEEPDEGEGLRSPSSCRRTASDP